MAAITHEADSALATVWRLLDAVHDPEIPPLSIADLGVLREVHVNDAEVTVVITPTYMGCPAMHVIAEDVRAVLNRAGYLQVVIETRLAPAWTTAWISAAGHAQLLAAGIAPPADVSAPGATMPGRPRACPLCSSTETELISEFGSTACKALYRCRSCLEPFDYFKCL